VSQPLRHELELGPHFEPKGYDLFLMTKHSGRKERKPGRTEPVYIITYSSQKNQDYACAAEQWPNLLIFNRRRPKWTDKNVSLILYVVSFEKKIGFQITSFIVERQVVLVILKCNES